MKWIQCTSEAWGHRRASPKWNSLTRSCSESTRQSYSTACVKVFCLVSDINLKSWAFFLILFIFTSEHFYHFCFFLKIPKFNNSDLNQQSVGGALSRPTDPGLLPVNDSLRNQLTGQSEWKTQQGININPCCHQRWLASTLFMLSLVLTLVLLKIH